MALELSVSFSEISSYTSSTVLSAVASSLALRKSEMISLNLLLIPFRSETMVSEEPVTRLLREERISCISVTLWFNESEVLETLSPILENSMSGIAVS